MMFALAMSWSLWMQSQKGVELLVKLIFLMPKLRLLIQSEIVTELMELATQCMVLIQLLHKKEKVTFGSVVNIQKPGLCKQQQFSTIALCV